MSEQDYIYTNISLNRGNCTFDTTNGVISLPLRNKEFRDSQITLKSLSIPVSWSTIKSSLNNNTFSIQFGALNIPVVLPDSLWGISGAGNTVQAYIKFLFDQNNLYLLDNLGNKVYYLDIIVNLSSYRVSVIYTVVPSVLPATYSDPHNLISNYAGVCPQIIFDNSEFNTFLGGVKNTTYPSINTASGSLNLPNTPDVSQNLSVINMDTNFVVNEIQNNRYLYSFSWLGTSFGSFFVDNPSYPDWLDLTAGNYNSFDISLKDAIGRNVSFLDTDISIILTIRQKRTD